VCPLTLVYPKFFRPWNLPLPLSSLLPPPPPPPPPSTRAHPLPPRPRCLQALSPWRRQSTNWCCRKWMRLRQLLQQTDSTKTEHTTHRAVLGGTESLLVEGGRCGREVCEGRTGWEGWHSTHGQNAAAHQQLLQKHSIPHISRSQGGKSLGIVEPLILVLLNSYIGTPKVSSGTTCYY
jgi:hypothetical protein